MSILSFEDGLSQMSVGAECEGIKFVQTVAKLNKSIDTNTNDKTSFLVTAFLFDLVFIMKNLAFFELKFNCRLQCELYYHIFWQKIMTFSEEN